MAVKIRASKTISSVKQRSQSKLLEQNWSVQSVPLMLFYIFKLDVAHSCSHHVTVLTWLPEQNVPANQYSISHLSCRNGKILKLWDHQVQYSLMLLNCLQSRGNHISLHVYSSKHRVNHKSVIPYLALRSTRFQLRGWLSPWRVQVRWGSRGGSDGMHTVGTWLQKHTN